MLYDNRMYPQALEHNGHVYIVWRGTEGLPHIVSYHLALSSLSEPFMLLDGLDIEIDAQKYARDHHYAPVIWIDRQGRIHTLFGCHGNSGGIHLVSTQQDKIDQWEVGSEIYGSISYPQVHQIFENRTLVYFRDRGHLGSWTYRISPDDGISWEEGSLPVVDLNRTPHTGFLASHAGSYHTTRVSHDGRTLHVAFIWKVEEPMPNDRYQEFLGDHTQRYNLYYLSVDLPSGKTYNRDGKKLNRPVDKLTADRDCLVWNTQERVAAVPPSIFLDEEDK
ncbi:MAG: BNR-4 repeat-containing protein, partial [bacterium]